MIKIVCDLMGADKPASFLLEGAIRAINLNNDLFVTLVGDINEITNALKEYSYNPNQLEILPSTEVVTNYDVPTRAFKQKPNSSLVLGLNLAKTHDAFVSCGSTGAVLVSSIFILGKIGDVRPALASVLKSSLNKEFILVDCGANVDTRAEQLVEFAKMGVAFAKAKGNKNPTVAILSNGAEDKKGNSQTKEAFQLLKDTNLNFVGNIEANTIMFNPADVITTDGFLGNVFLKSIEGTGKAILSDINEYMKNNPNDVEAIKCLMKYILPNYDQTKGGAILLGVNKPVVKGHGAATNDTIYAIINEAYNLAKGELISKMISELK